LTQTATPDHNRDFPDQHGREIFVIFNSASTYFGQHSMSQMNPYASPQVPQAQMQPPPGSEQFAPCPSCRCVFAKRVGFTWWGGILGPKMLTHVKCVQCGQAYNGKSGKSNDTAIAIYLAVSLAIGVALGVAVALAGAIK